MRLCTKTSSIASTTDVEQTASMTAAVLPAILYLSFSNPQSTLRVVLEEGRLLRNQSAWNTYEQAIQHVLQAHQKQYGGWKEIIAPPPPSIAAIELPLPFLLVCLVDDCPAARRGYSGDHPMPWLYLSAISEANDSKKAAVLLAYGDTATLPYLQDHAYELLGKYATAEQAAEILKVRLTNPNEKHVIKVVTAIVQEQAEKLPALSRSLAYEHMIAMAPNGPSNGNPEHTWKLLFRLDAPKARQDIITRLNESELYYALSIIIKHPGPSKALASAIRKFEPKEPGHDRAIWWHALVVSDNDLAEDLERHVIALLSQLGKGMRHQRDPVEVGADPISQELWNIMNLLDHYEGKGSFSIRKRIIESPKIGWSDCLSLLKPLARKADPRVLELGRRCATKGAPDIVKKRLGEWGY